jgi:quercetin dioxygenase-like cupin family protein
MSEKQDKFHEASDAYLATFAAMTSRPVAGMVEYHLPEGQTCVGKALLYEPSVAVQRAMMSAGSRFAPHAHAEAEWIIVDFGELQVTVGDKTQTLAAGQGICFDPLTVHECLALTDCWMIGITIPHSPGYPRG